MRLQRRPAGEMGWLKSIVSVEPKPLMTSWPKAAWNSNALVPEGSRSRAAVDRRLRIGQVDRRIGSVQKIRGAARVQKACFVARPTQIDRVAAADHRGLGCAGARRLLLTKKGVQPLRGRFAIQSSRDSPRRVGCLAAAVK